MEKSQELNEVQSLQLIREMINRAKDDLGNQSFYPILWGWIVLIGSLGHFILLKYTDFERPYIVWAIILVGIVASFIKGYKERKNTSSGTYSGTIVAMVWGVFLINYFILVPFLGDSTYLIGSLVLLMAGGSIFLCGFILKFRPFYVGGIFTWVLAIFSFMVSVEYQLLASAVAVIFGLLIPGYLLKNRKAR